MLRYFRLIAVVLIVAFTANVQAWASTMEDEAFHDGDVEIAALAQHGDDAHHQGTHDCLKAGHHCCHGINHLLGQVSSEMALIPRISASKPVVTGTSAALSTYPDSIYRPPLNAPSLT